MKKFLLLLAIFGLLAATSVYAEEYVFDKAHTHIGFSVKHILGKVPGNFKEFDGTFKFDTKNPASGKIDVTIQATSINTDNEMRDKHLKTADFFDVEKYPALTYKSKKVSKVEGSDNKYKVEGDLTIHGVTKPVSLDVEYLGGDTMMGARIVGFTATAKIDRRDFGLVWSKTLESGNLVVGNDVDILLDISGMAKADLKKLRALVNRPAPHCQHRAPGAGLYRFEGLPAGHRLPATRAGPGSEKRKAQLSIGHGPGPGQAL